MIVLLLSFIALGASGLAAAAEAPGPKVGDKAPEFTLPSTTGQPISLNDFRGKRIVLLEFYGADFSPV
jgi:peroxiredoxin Q/BCP